MKSNKPTNQMLIKDIKNHLWATEGRLIEAVYYLADLQLRSKDGQTTILDKDGKQEPMPWNAAIYYLSVIVTRLQNEMQTNVKLLQELSPAMPSIEVDTNKGKANVKDASSNKPK